MICLPIKGSTLYSHVTQVPLKHICFPPVYWHSFQNYVWETCTNHPVFALFFFYIKQKILLCGRRSLPCRIFAANAGFELGTLPIANEPDLWPEIIYSGLCLFLQPPVPVPGPGLSRLLPQGEEGWARVPLTGVSSILLFLTLILTAPAAFGALLTLCLIFTAPSIWGHTNS